MSNLAVKVNQRSQEQTKRRQHQHTETQAVPVKRRLPITLGERVLLVLFVLGLAAAGVQLISSSVASYQSSIEVQKLEAQVEAQTKKNSDLSVQVTELSNYDRLMSKAKEMGLKLDKDNVKGLTN
ncbi:cell division protein FtsL [Metabacillus sp. 84]|uniref:cell division protein FtsL n=1 Tax=unclassified Metabacillus TaxID=2675274 RepID=UPI003CFAC113